MITELKGMVFKITSKIQKSLSRSFTNAGTPPIFRHFFWSGQNYEKLGLYFFSYAKRYIEIEALSLITSFWMNNFFVFLFQQMINLWDSEIVPKLLLCDLCWQMDTAELWNQGLPENWQIQRVIVGIHFSFLHKNSARHSHFDSLICTLFTIQLKTQDDTCSSSLVSAGNGKNPVRNSFWAHSMLHIKIPSAATKFE